MLGGDGHQGWEMAWGNRGTLSLLLRACPGKPATPLAVVWTKDAAALALLGSPWS